MFYNFINIDKKWNNYFYNYIKNKNKNLNIYNKYINKKFYLLNMFPYPSGEGLHVGHTLGYIISDIINRYKIMSNYNTFNPIGFDSFGLPTEYYSFLIKKHPLITTKINIKNFKNQLKKLSIIFNWSNSLYTSNVNYYKWTQYLFIKLFNSWYNYKKKKADSIKNLIIILKKKKYIKYQNKFIKVNWNKINYKKKNFILNKFRLIYKKKSYINWCPKLKTVLSNEEIYKNKSIRGGFNIKLKKLSQWHIKITPYLNRLIKNYKNINLPKNIKILQKKWINKTIWFKIKQIQIFYKKKKKFKVNVYVNNFKIFLKYCNYLIISPLYYNIKLFKIKSIYKLINKNKYWVLKSKYKYLHPNGKLINIYISNYNNIEYNNNIIIINHKIKKDKLFILKNKFKIFKNKNKNNIIKYKILKKKKKFFKLKDIIFSRQKYWGEPIPIYYKKKIPICIKKKYLPLKLPNKYYKSLKKNNKWAWDIKNHKIVNNKYINNKTIFKLDTNIMSSYAGSNWYYLRYLDNKNSKLLFNKKIINKWCPMDIYIGGTEHVTSHLIYLRFITHFLYDLNFINFKEPFKKFINHGLILYNSYYCYINNKNKIFYSKNLEKNKKEKIYIHIKYIKNNNLNIKLFLKKNSIYKKFKFIYNKKFQCYSKLKKMSKSKLNVINPNSIIKKYGTDVYRIYLLFLGPYNKNKIWNISKIKGIKKFLNKIWILFNFKINNLLKLKDFNIKKKKDYLFINKYIFNIIYYIKIKKFNLCISNLMLYLNYIIKLKYYSKYIFKNFLLLLNIFAPNITEEIWEKIFKKSNILNFRLPKFNKKKYIKDNKIILQINSKFKKIIKNKNKIINFKKKQIKLKYFKKYLINKIIKKIIFIKNKIINIITK
ncbi:MAG: class I tRNA ligase family protein [Candidatus Shikimatogenerans sp. AspAUS03]|uniref:leucine--tRNA ligase n=1 Tax=Candidatus Shikimatogenerans sp. AspAUS03 TaxID=3158563 RepID=A0AAU7QSX5_9FLAO